jgi:aryl-alcohol dehydrogenase-like predicted oxidoreductase
MMGGIWRIQPTPPNEPEAKLPKRDSSTAPSLTVRDHGADSTRDSTSRAGLDSCPRLHWRTSKNGGISLEKRKIGSLEVTVVGIGSDNFGGRIDEDRTREVVFAALDAGVNFFDTADDYPVVPPGLSTKSEEFLGRALKGHRQEVVLATKFGLKYDEEHLGGGKADYVRACAEDSLRRLDTDYIDLFQFHRPDPETPVAETLGALAELVDAGKVIEIGCSNFSVDQMREASEVVASGKARFVSVQNEYSLLNRTAELDVIPECEATGLAFLPFFPLYNGLLAGGYRRGKPWPEDSRFLNASDERKARVFSEQNLEIIESLALYAEGCGHTLLELTFARLLANPCLASVIAGAVSGDQVRANAATAAWTLTAAEIADIDAIAPIS